MRVFERLQQHAQTQPDAVAFNLVARPSSGMASLSYRQYARAVAHVANAIQSTTPDDAVILIQLPNSLTYPVAYLAILAAGRTAFPLHPALTRHEVAEAAKKTCAKWVISDSEAVDGVTPITPEQVTRWITESLSDSTIPRLSGHAGGNMLLQSSGTTGSPKIVERSVDSIDAVAKNVADSVGLAPCDQVLAAIPMCHSYGIENAVVGPVWAGSTVQVCEGFDPDIVASAWARLDHCVFPAVPVMIDLLSSREGLPAPKSLKAIYAAGATMPAAVASAFAQQFGQHVGQLYGATEIGSVTYDRPGTNALPEGCVGRPMTGVSIRILDLDQPANHPPLEPGQPGQVAVNAPSMLSQYLCDEPTPLVDGHFLTGDLGVIDSSGSLNITGRVKTLIEVGGMKVNPIEVEGVLVQHPGVNECVVVSNLVSKTVSRITAYFVPTDPASPPTAAELRSYAKERLAPYKVPRVFKPIDQLPRTSLGKVQRAALTEAGV